MESSQISLTEQNRQNISHLLRNPGQGLVAGDGPCAPNIDSVQQVRNEVHDFSQVTNSNKNRVVGFNRIAIWKPRSNPAESWNGMETTHPVEADNLISYVDRNYGTASMEIGLDEHVARYAGRLAFAWFGARNIDSLDQMQRLAAKERSLPIGIKNGLDGHIDSALERIEVLQKERDRADAPITLIFRGGKDFGTPSLWEDAYIEAVKETSGRTILDGAHGGEMAHDPNGQFGKSVEGQEACIDHGIELAKYGIIPVGIMIESSDAASPIDPVIPFDTGIEKILTLEQVIAEQRKEKRNARSILASSAMSHQPYFA